MRDELFSTSPTGPDAASWAAASFRALHPLRWGLCVVGLAATAAIAAVAQSLFDGQAPRFAGWFGEPWTQAQEFGVHLADRSSWALVARLGPALAVVAGVWAIIGCWIARHELLARHHGQSYATADRIEPGPTKLVTGRLKALVVCAPLVLILCALLLLPVAIAGLLNHLGGPGAILVAVLLPVVLVADLVLLLVASGVLAWPLMPVTIAAENSDEFDALSRAYNYAYMRPLRFILLMVATLAPAALPLAAVLYVLAGPVENWIANSGHPVVWAAAALSASIFWSLQTLVYLHLRTAVDGVDAIELAGDAGSKTVAAPAPPVDDRQSAAVSTGSKPATPQGLLNHVLIFGLMLATWVVTARLFARFGGEDAGWLGWGIGEQFRPAADGLYSVASLLAAVWGAIWIAAPILVALRRALRPDPAPVNPSPPG